MVTRRLLTASSAAAALFLLVHCGESAAACPPTQELVDGLCVTDQEPPAPSDPSEAALTFCADYELTCGFGDAGRDADADSCHARFDSYGTERQDCVVNHLGLAGADDPSFHCPHATGASPCDG